MTRKVSSPPVANPRGTAPGRRTKVADVKVLPSRLEMDCETNLQALVEHARLLEVFGKSVDFEAAVWDIPKLERKNLNINARHNLYFATKGNGRSESKSKGRELFTPEFAHLLKSIVCLREFFKKGGQHAKIIAAGRALYESLSEAERNPRALTSSHFDKAAQLLRTRLKPSAQYTHGNALVEIGEFVNAYCLSRVAISFKNPFQREEIGSRIDDEARRIRESKSLSKEDIDAVITMSEMVQSDRDILLARLVELLFCAPFRVAEELNLPYDCERRSARMIRGKPALDDSGQPISDLGIAYDGSKGFPDAVKMVPRVMQVVAENALADIKRITQPARDVAAWMVQHPGRIYFPRPWRLANPETEVYSRDLPALLGVSERTAGLLTLKQAGVAPLARRRDPGISGLERLVFRLGDIEQWLLTLQPELSPNAPRRLDEYLFLVPRHFFHPNHNVMPAVVSFVTRKNVQLFLSGTTNIHSIFKRLEILGLDGLPFKLRSHMFRHFLNTIAQEGGMSQFDIARWSGRISLHQNAVYDHVSPMIIAERARSVLLAGAMMGPVVETANRLEPVIATTS